jgi:hypothetical protein
MAMMQDGVVRMPVTKRLMLTPCKGSLTALDDGSSWTRGATRFSRHAQTTGHSQKTTPTSAMQAPEITSP